MITTAGSGFLPNIINLTEMYLKEISVKFEIFGLEFTIKVKSLKK